MFSSLRSCKIGNEAEKGGYKQMFIADGLHMSRSCARTYAQRAKIEIKFNLGSPLPNDLLFAVGSAF
jgi:hypothetical protein